MSTRVTRVVLTGGAGFIGSHVAEALLRRGTELTIIDRLDEFYSPAWKKANLDEIRHAGNYQFSPADICEMDRVRDILTKARPDAIVHLAARAGVGPSLHQPLLYERVNVGGTLILLELCRELGIGKFIFGSSSSVYGATTRAPFSENQTDLRPISPYGATKLAGEMFCYTYARLFRISALCLRFFTVYGPRQRPDLAIHKFTALIEAGKPVSLFGDGSAGRDYTWVDDIVLGVLAALDYEPSETAGVPFEIFNLGNAHPVKLTELVEALERATGKRATREFKPPQPGDVPLTWADITKASRLLGYRPATGIQEGLERFVAWYRAADPGRRA